MKKLLLSVIASAYCLASVGQESQAADAGIVDTDIASYPLYVASGLKQPLIMLLLGRDHSMYYEAYNDLTDLDEDGSVDGVFTPHVIYDGIFESNWCYQYDKDMFVMKKLAVATESYGGNPVYKCTGAASGLWSGNFLNYMTSSRMDIVKRILIGGQRYTNLANCSTKSPNEIYGTCRDSSGYPVLSRQYIPHDTHGWAKLYSKDDINDRCKKYGYSCRLDYWAPIGGDTSAMFGSVGRQLMVVTANNIYDSNLQYNGKRLSLGSYKCLSEGKCSDTTSIFVWNWVARESGAFGDDKAGKKAKGPLSLDAGYTALNKPGVTSNNGHYSVPATKYNVVVQACNFAVEPSATMPSRCKNYGTESNKKYNTVGLLQDFSKEGAVDAYFGLITAIWNKDLEGKDAKKRAALRSPIADLSSATQVDQNNGDFVKDSVYSLINILSLSTKEGTPNSTAGGSTSANWSDCTINGANNTTTPERGCTDWGNPLVPLLQKSYEYFSGAKITENSSDSLAVKRFTDDQAKLEFKYPRLSTGSGNGDTPYRSFDYCYRPINFILTDENVSMDYRTGLAGVSDANLQEGFDYIANREGDSFIGDHIFGESTDAKSMSTGQTIHTVKNVETEADLMKVRGVSTLEPNLQGSLKGAALAAYLHRNPMKYPPDDLNADKQIPGFEHFAVAMASYLPQFEVYAKNGKKVLIVPTCKAPRRPHSGSIDNIGNYTYDPEDSYTSNCAVADVFYVNSSYSKVGNDERLTSLEFRVTYEDNEAGSDFDMDALFTYKLWADESDENLINVSVTGFYHDTYSGQIGGYSIFGTNGVITPNYDKCRAKQCSINQTGYVVDGRNFFLDMMKVDQNSNNYTLMRSFSDPYNEFNNIRGDLAPKDEVSNQYLTSPVVVTSEGARSKDNNHRYNCIQDSQINSYIKGWVYNAGANKSVLGNTNYIKYLPSFSSACISTVTRKFYVTGFDENSGFYDSPLAYAAYYGSKYGEKGSRTSRLSNNPNYFYVTNASKLASQITSALTKAVGSGGHSGSGLTFPSLDVSEDGEVVAATFDTIFWTGALHKSKLVLDDDGSVKVESVPGTSNWENDEVSFTGRKVLIADKKGNLTPIDAKYDLLSNASTYPLADAVIEQFGMGDCSLDERKDFVHRYLEYVINGDGSNEYEGDESEMDNTGLSTKMSCGQSVFYGFHARSDTLPRQSKIKLGAIISSTPQYFTVGGVTKVIFAANDGMVHVVNDSNGRVEYSIIPYVSQQYMPKYAKAGNVDHLINDGILSVKTFKIKKASSETVSRTIAIGTLGAVHPGVYAIELTGTPKMLWELSEVYSKTEGSDERVRNVANLGAIKSKINMVKFNDDKNNYILAVFGNGYNSADGVAGIIAVNALTGKVYTDVEGDSRFKGGVLVNGFGWSNPDCTRDQFAYVDYKDAGGNCYKNGMNEVLLRDRNSDGVLDYIYATDLYGNVYRVKSEGSGHGKQVKKWTLAHIHTTVSPLPSPSEPQHVKIQPITTAPALGTDANGKPMVFVGTGKYLGASDLKTGDIQSVWALSDKSFTSESSSDTTAILEGCRSDPTNDHMYCYRNSSKLKKRYLKPSSSGNGLREDYGGEYDVDNYDGWVLDFDTVGTSGISERVKNNMMVLERHLLVITATPSGSDCDGGGTGNWYDLDITSGTFYKTGPESQSYSSRFYTDLSLIYNKTNPDGKRCIGNNCGGPSSEEENIKKGKRLGSGPRCLNAMACAGDAEGQLANCRGALRICPRIESWQHIYN